MVKPSGPITIDLPGASKVLALDINQRGEIVGRYTSAGQNHKPNELGVIVGGFGENSNESLFVLRHRRFATIALPNGKPISQDDGGMNGWGEIVGTYCNGAPPCLIGPTDNHGFLLVGNQLRTIDVDGATATSLTAINAQGDIVGGYTDANGASHAFLLKRRVSRW